MEKYIHHEMEIILFDEQNVFMTEWASDGEEGEDQYSIKPEFSDI